MENRIYTEKYRPTTFEEVVGLPKELKNLLNNLSDREAILLTSTPGVGKTCISKILERKYEDSLVINASDERGIDTIRTKIKNFVMNMSLNGGSKYIGLEEMDSITIDGQKALRKIIEDSPNCIWVLTANYENKIIEAIKNRCTHFRLIKPDKEEIKKLLIDIEKRESITVSDEATNKIIELNYPSIRGMVKQLQLLKKLDKNIESEDIINNIKELIEVIKTKKYKASMLWAVESMMEYEFLIGKVYDGMIKEEFSGEQKLEIIKATRRALVDIGYVARKEIVFGGYLADLWEVI